MEKNYIEKAKEYFELTTEGIITKLYDLQNIVIDLNEDIFTLEVANADIKADVEERVVMDSDLKNDKQRKVETKRLLEKAGYNSNINTIHELKRDISKNETTISLLKKIYYSRINTLNFN